MQWTKSLVHTLLHLDACTDVTHTHTPPCPCSWLTLVNKHDGIIKVMSTNAFGTVTKADASICRVSSMQGP